MAMPPCLFQRRFPPLLAGLIGLAALPGAAVDLELSHHFQPGQSYQLSIRNETQTDSSSRGADRPTFRESVAVDYEATVVVLAVDADGCPVREQHRDVSMTFTRPDETGSLFSKPSTFQVERVDGNDVRITTGGDRVSRDIERVLREPLRRNHDRCARAAWLEPGRPVEVGESWPLDVGFARQLLRDRGLSGVALADHPTATLELQDGWPTVRYSIPVSRVRVRGLPQTTRVAGSRAMLEGTLVVPNATRVPSAELSSNLELDLHGAAHTLGLGRSFGWKLHRMESHAQRVRMLPQVAVQR
jgi:hypothetical protein